MARWNAKVHSVDSQEPKKIAVYVRWSTEDQGEGFTLQVQTESCAKYLDSQGITFDPGMLFVDDGYSGGDLNRPGITNLREKVQKGEVGTVICYRYDRLSREQADFAPLVRREWKDKVKVVSVSEPFDAETAIGRLQQGIMVTFAEYERSVIKERTQSGLRKKAESGGWCGTGCPYGFKIVPITDSNGNPVTSKGRVMKRLVVDQSVAHVVRMVFAKYLEGVGFLAVADWLNSQGIPAPKGDAWTKVSINAMIQNPAYVGDYRYGTVHTRDAHEAIIDRATFEQVQAMRQQRTTTHPRQLAGEYPLSGILRCPYCSGAMSGERYSWKTKNGRKYVGAYVCNKNRNTNTCKREYFRQVEMEASFLDKLESLQSDTSLVALVAQRANANRDALLVARQAKEQAIGELDKVERNLRNLNHTYIEQRDIPEGERSFTDAEFKQMKTEYLAQKDALTEVINRPLPEAVEFDTDDLIERARHIRRLWERHGTTNERRTLAQAFLSLHKLVAYAGTDGVTIKSIE